MAETTTQVFPSKSVLLLHCHWLFAGPVILCSSLHSNAASVGGTGSVSLSLPAQYCYVEAWGKVAEVLSEGKKGLKELDLPFQGWLMYPSGYFTKGRSPSAAEMHLRLSLWGPRLDTFSVSLSELAHFGVWLLKFYGVPLSHPNRWD